MKIVYRIEDVRVVNIFLNRGRINTGTFNINNCSEVLHVTFFKQAFKYIHVLCKVNSNWIGIYKIFKDHFLLINISMIHYISVLAF